MLYLVREKCQEPLLKVKIMRKICFGNFPIFLIIFFVNDLIVSTITFFFKHMPYGREGALIHFRF